MKDSRQEHLSPVRPREERHGRLADVVWRRTAELIEREPHVHQRGVPSLFHRDGAQTHCRLAVVAHNNVPAPTDGARATERSLRHLRDGLRGRGAK